MYVCVAEKCEVGFFLRFFPPSLGKKPKMMVFKDVCMRKAKTIIDGIFWFLFAPFL